MQIPVVTEPITPGGFRARSGEPLALTAEGSTREEALQKLREQLAARIAAGAEVTSLDVAPAPSRWASFTGIWEKGDPLVQEWIQIMEENRRAADADPDYL
jgi:hypothetical protein